MPSHSQVSYSVPVEAPPPHRTVRPLARSYDMACPPLAAGDGPVGVICCQLVPSHSHVSFWGTGSPVPAMLPPNSTIRPRATSLAMACATRPDGEFVGD